jgi:uncharacterized membrane protein YagU involved in acid resistance
VGLLKNIGAGAAGGLAGGLAMFAVRTLGIEADVIQATLPDRFEQGVERMLGFAGKTDNIEEKQLAVAEHLALSAGLGAGYGMLYGMFKPRSIVAGMVYAMGIYVVIVGVLGPKLRVTRAPWSKPNTATGGELLAHVLFGLVTALVTRRLRR